MSISSDSTRKAGPFTGTGAIVPLPFSFKVFTAADVLVIRTDLSGVETTLTLSSDYTVTLNSNQDSNPGGVVTPLVAPGVGYLTTLSSQVAAIQSVILTNTGGFFPTVLNDAMDRLTILVQQLKEQMSRAVTTSISSGISPSVMASYIVALYNNLANIISVAGDKANIDAVAGDLTNINAVAADTANINNVASDLTNINTVAANISSINTNITNITAIQNASANAAAAATSATNAAAQLTSFKNVYYGPLATNPTTRPDSSAMQAGDEYYNTSSKSLQVYNGTSWGAAGVVFNPIQQSFSGTGSQTNFTLSQAPGVVAALLVSIGGVNQVAGTDYTISGTTLSFTTAPPAGTNNINTVNFGVAGSIAVPANASITNAMLQAGIVQPSNLSTGAPSWDSSGNLALGGGQLNLGSNGQIKFPAAQNPSSDVNTLDDYEEGTWTPNINSNNGTGTFARKVGSYVKIGKQVTIWFAIDWGSSLAAGTTQYLTGIPFPIGSIETNTILGQVGANGPMPQTNDLMTLSGNRSVMYVYTGGAQQQATITFAGGSATYWVD